MPNLDPTQIRVAATCAIWKAPLGTVTPTDSVSAYGASFVNLGYTTDAGFTVTQNLKTVLIHGHQSVEPLLLINQALDRKINIESLESDRANLSLAWGSGSVTSTGVAVGGSITIGTAGVLTTSAPHGLAVGAPVFVTTIATSTGIVANTTYWVIAVGSTTTLTLSATLGGVALTTTAGTAATLVPAGPFAVTIPDSAIAVEFTLGIDWSHGAFTNRLIIPRATLLTLPALKFTRQDIVRYPLEVQVLKPVDGSQSVLPYGSDWAATS